MREALSSNHASFDDQISDVVSWLSFNTATGSMMEHSFLKDFPEYNSLVWESSWMDAEASGVDPEYMSWVCDWIENNTLVYWEDGEPWIGDSPTVI